MARPISIRDEDILVAARQVFLERGIRATSAEVAERAGVSEGSIFKRFASKEQLFQAAMRVDMDATIDFASSLLDRVGEGDVRDHLVELGGNILAMFRLILPLMMMRWSNPEENLCDARQGSSPPLRLLGAVMAYLSAEVAAGRVGPADVEIVSRAFLGGIQNYAFFEILLRARREEPPTPEGAFLVRLVDGLWRGCAPPEPTLARVSEARPVVRSKGQARPRSATHASDHATQGSQPPRRRRASSRRG